MGAVAETALAIGANVANEAGNLIFGNLKQKQQLKGQRQALAQQNAAAYDMWLKTNYSAQVRELEKAGLNPGLIYGMGGGGGATTGSASAMPAPQSGGMDIGSIVQMKLLEAQIENIKADTQNKLGDAANKPKVGKQLDQQTENLILEGIIKDYTGKSLKIDYMIKDNTSLERYGAESNELEARKWIADNIIRLGENGKLAQMSNEELEGMILANAKSRAERKNIEKQFEILEENLKGAKLSNVILGMDAKLQEQTGVDKSAPWYFKMVMRILTGLYEANK